MGKGKTEFTRQEYEEIRSLVSQLETATSDKKKNIRGKIRNLGLYWSEVSGNIPYTTSNLDSLSKRGILKIIDSHNVTNPSSIIKFDTQEKKFNSPNTEAIKKSIFISYKRLDKDKVFPIKEKIEKNLGDICWIDIDGIESDAQFVSVIIKAIKECEIFLFMYSHLHDLIGEYETDWTIRELQYAEKQKKKIVFINIDRSELGDWFSFMFGQKQQVDALSETHINRLINDLKSWLKNEYIEFEKNVDSTNIETEDLKGEIDNNGQQFYYVEDIIAKFIIERQEKGSKFSPLEKESYIKVDWEHLYNFLKVDLGYIDLTRTYLANSSRCFFETGFIKENSIIVTIKRILYSQQFKNDIIQFLYEKDINFDNIQDKYINWDAYFEYMNTRYNFHLNKWEIFVQRYGQPVKLNDMVSRIIDKTIGLRIPIYPTNN